MKLISHKSVKTYVSKKDGKTYNYVNYYLEMPNGKWVAVRPVDNNGYDAFKLIAEVR